jgi:hypothetical protein
VVHSNRQSSLSPLAPFLPLPKYFESEWSYAQYRIPSQSSHISLSATAQSPTADVPDEERCVVGWIEAPISGDQTGKAESEYQLVALTYAGGWYRLSLPSKGTAATAPSPSSTGSISGSPPRLTSIPRPRTGSGSSQISRFEKGKEREKEKDNKESRECVLLEFRRSGAVANVRSSSLELGSFPLGCCCCSDRRSTLIIVEHVTQPLWRTLMLNDKRCFWSAS